MTKHNRILHKLKDAQKILAHPVQAEKIYIVVYIKKDNTVTIQNTNWKTDLIKEETTYHLQWHNRDEAIFISDHDPKFIRRLRIYETPYDNYVDYKIQLDADIYKRNWCCRLVKKEAKYVIANIPLDQLSID